MNHLFVIIFIILNFSFVKAQDYCSPVDIKMLLSGTFGELRNNHFHSGIDIKTDGVIGKNVYAIADGHVSRIKVSTWGYGKTIYIQHPEGKTSVYAHLKKFSKKINNIIEKEQYKKESFEINYYPNKDELKIKQGEIIALSGNSGSSQGAHLHFEIRDTKTEKPINPLSSGIIINDNIPPTIKKIKLYSINGSKIDNKTENKTIPVQRNKSTYIINHTPIINGKFAISISTYDKTNGSNNKNGIYSIKLFIDSALFYEIKFDELDFKKTRYINAHLDYEEYKKNQTKYHRCFKLKNNQLENYTTIKNNGIIDLHDNQLHMIQVQVSDISGNISHLSFNIQMKTKKDSISQKNKEQNRQKKRFYFSTPNIFKTPNFQIHMQKHSLYDILDFEYNLKDSIEGVFGKIHGCHYEHIPVHKKYAISIKENVPIKLRNKVYIAKIKQNNGYAYMGGNWSKGFLRTKTREFGDFCIIADTISPEIQGINIYPGKKLNNQNTIKCVIKDKGSGIKTYKGYIDGKWILMEYDHKKDYIANFNY